SSYIPSCLLCQWGLAACTWFPGSSFRVLSSRFVVGISGGVSLLTHSAPYSPYKYVTLITMADTAAPTYCQECGRANSATALRCIWCDIPLKRGAVQRFEPVRVDIEYMGGIQGLDDPSTVRLEINSSGFEVRSLVTGSRVHKIPAYSIVDARVVDAST